MADGVEHLTSLCWLDGRAKAVTKPYKFIGFGWAFISQTPVRQAEHFQKGCFSLFSRKSTPLGAPAARATASHKKPPRRGGVKQLRVASSSIIKATSSNALIPGGHGGNGAKPLDIQVQPGWKSGFRAGCRPDSSRDSLKIGPSAGRRVAFDGVQPSIRPKSDPEAWFPARVGSEGWDLTLCWSVYSDLCLLIDAATRFAAIIRQLCAARPANFYPSLLWPTPRR